MLGSVLVAVYGPERKQVIAGRQGIDLDSARRRWVSSKSASLPSYVCKISCILNQAVELLLNRNANHKRAPSPGQRGWLCQAAVLGLPMLQPSAQPEWAIGGKDVKFQTAQQLISKSMLQQGLKCKSETRIAVSSPP